MVCSSGIGFDPVVDGTRLTFGFEGIWQGTAVLYDHATRSRWMHLTGTCFAGEHAGVTLKRLSTGRHTTWVDWRGTYPATDVLAREPRLMRRAGDLGYFTRKGARSGHPYRPRQFEPTIQTHDARLAANDLCYGIVVGEHARAYPFARLKDTPVVEERLEGVEVTVWFDPPSRSVAAFHRRRGDRRLSFHRGPGGAVTDRESGSRWNLEGLCVRGPLKGAQLDPVFGLMSEWYGWFAHHPKTTVWSP